MKLLLNYIVVTIITFFFIICNIKGINNILLSEGTLIPYFDESTLKYNVFVSNETESFTINAELSENKEVVTGTGNYNLTDGINKIILKSLSENGTVKTYTINVYKNYKEAVDYESATLTNLDITGYEINFDEHIYEYKINIESENSLDIKYELKSDYSSVKIVGNSNFKEGENIVNIIVTSKDENNKNIYVIKVNKLVSAFNESTTVENNTNILGKQNLTKQEKNIIVIVIISICTIILSLVFFLLFIVGKKH